jgi:hypothetical protein
LVGRSAAPVGRSLAISPCLSLHGFTLADGRASTLVCVYTSKPHICQTSRCLCCSRSQARQGHCQIFVSTSCVMHREGYLTAQDSLNTVAFLNIEPLGSIICGENT